MERTNEQLHEELVELKKDVREIKKRLLANETLLDLENDNIDEMDDDPFEESDFREARL